MNSDNEKKCCGSCQLGMPQASLNGQSVCAGKYYGKILTEDDEENFVCEDWEPYPPNEIFFGSSDTND